MDLTAIPTTIPVEWAVLTLLIGILIGFKLCKSIYPPATSKELFLRGLQNNTKNNDNQSPSSLGTEIGSGVIKH